MSNETDKLVETLRLQLVSDELSAFLWNTTREAIAFVSPTGVLRLVNPAFSELLGYAVNELEGMTFQNVTVRDDIVADEEEFSRLLRGEIQSYTMDKKYVTKYGKEVTVSLKAVNYRTGVLVVGQALHLDVFSFDHLAPAQETRIIQLLIGRWLVENWKKALVLLFLFIGGARIDQVIEYALRFLPVQN